MNVCVSHAGRGWGGGELRRIYRSLIGLMHSPHGQGELGEGASGNIAEEKK